MRVTARTYYQDYAKTVGNLHSELNKSMEQVSTGRKYPDAKSDPIAYYAGKKMDNQYNIASAQLSIIKDVQNRLYQQETGAKQAQETLRYVNTEAIAASNGTVNQNITSVETYESDFKQRLESIVDDLNTQYDNFYVYGGNDMETVPFTLDIDTSHGEKDSTDENSISLTYHHKFPGDSSITNVKMTYKYDSSKNSYGISYSLVDEDGKDTAGKTEKDALNALVSSMREQGRMDTGYGSLTDRSTLFDTYTGGLNMITGISSDALKTLSDKDAAERIKGTTTGEIPASEDSMQNSAFALLSKLILTSDNYVKTEAKGDSTKTQAALNRYTDDVSDFLSREDNLESRVSETYRKIGIAYAALETTSDRLEAKQDSLTAEYKDKLGIDTYDAIVKMYSNQYAYNAAMKVGSHIMQSSLFDFVNS